MANIAKTKLGTADPVSICSGLPIYPIGGANLNLPFGFEPTLANWNQDIYFWLWKFSLAFGAGAFFGVCGPGWGIKMDVEGETSGNTVSLTVTDDDLIAGLVIGASFNVAASVKTSGKAWRWYWAWKHEWWGGYWYLKSEYLGYKDIWNLELSGTLDLIWAVKEVIKLILDEQKAKKYFAEQDKLPDDVIKPPYKYRDTAGDGLQKYYGVVDQQTATFNDKLGKLRAEPKITMPVDIWDWFAKADQVVGATPFNTSFYSFNQVLKGNQVYISLGPEFGLIFPVNVEINKIFLDDVEYSDCKYNSGQVTGTMTLTGTPPTTVSSVNLEFKQSPGIDVYVGVFASVTWQKVMNLSFKWGIGLLDALNLNLNVATFNQALNETSVGGTLSASGCQPCGQGMALADVVFE